MLALTLVGFALLPGAVFARQSTPSAEGQDTVECTSEPRPFPIWDGTPAIGVGAPPVTTEGPYVPPRGPGADEATVEGITRTVQEVVACTNAGETRRMLSLFSDNRVRAFFAGPGAPTSAEVEAVLEQPATPVAEEERLEVVSVTDSRRLTNGRVGVFVETRSGETTFLDFVSFIEEGGRWLVEDSVAIDSSTQVGATPTP